ncbi:MAG: hypothetical protein JWO22_1229 [Frankiales bacterium]|nr:hypothetical protein [Frankiales bacterium]
MRSTVVAELGITVAAKKDIERGLRATVYASREQVVEACLRAASTLGTKCEAVPSSAKVVVKIRPGLSRKRSVVSPTIGVNLSPGPDGAINVTATVEKYITTQSRVMFLPVGPKTLVGKGQLVSFLKGLGQELVAIDAGGGSLEYSGFG